MPTPPKTLKQLLQHVLATQFNGVQVGLAEALDLDQTHVSRLLRGMATTLAVESALRLARRCDLNPDEVLALAGKAELAQDIRVLYGKAAPVRQQLTGDERTWLETLRRLAPEHRKAVLHVARSLAAR